MKEGFTSLRIVYMANTWNILNCVPGMIYKQLNVTKFNSNQLVALSKST